ncbi:MAG: hypothetical protein ACWGQW_16350, partial [bacterium]
MKIKRGRRLLSPARVESVSANACAGNFDNLLFPAAATRNSGSTGAKAILRLLFVALAGEAWQIV